MQAFISQGHGIQTWAQQRHYVTKAYQALCMMTYCKWPGNIRVSKTTMVNVSLRGLGPEFFLDHEMQVSYCSVSVSI